MKVVLLCGGLGTRLKEETEFKPKPMVEIAGRPILWHIMKSFSHYGFNKFVLCLGYKGDIIKDYFYNYEIQNNDFTLTLGNGSIEIHNQHSEAGWEITFAETGLYSMTGARVKKIQKYMDDDIFMLTYGDGLCDINIKELIEFHKDHGKIATITGVLPPSRFGELLTKNNLVKSFNEKPQIHAGGYINGGFFVFNKKIFDYIPDDDNCILERQPLEDLVRDEQLCVYEHKGFWQCMDTYRDFELLNNMWKEGKASWKKWN
ncbi:MAG: glucose-1-phosphate cytidylyltransferase [Ignavibacteria bacterium]